MTQIEWPFFTVLHCVSCYPTTRIHPRNHAVRTGTPGRPRGNVCEASLVPDVERTARLGPINDGDVDKMT
jgi:hypothetical protein